MCKEAIAAIDVDGDLIKVSLSSGETFVTPKVYLFAGAQNGEILEQSLARDHGMNRELDVPEFDNTYITAISTVRYNHVNHPARPREGSGHVVTPITLGQLEIPGLIDFQANFSIVAEEYGDVLKTRLSGSIGTEVIPYVKDKHASINSEDDEKMAELYQKFFGELFPFLDTRQAHTHECISPHDSHTPAAPICACTHTYTQTCITEFRWTLTDV